MKYYNKILMALGAASFICFSCTDGYESLPVDQFTNDYVFSTSDSAGLEAIYFLNTIYDMLPNGHNRVGGDYLDAASDDAISIEMSSEPDVYKLAVGQYTASQRITSDMIWKDYYTAIRRSNIMINGIDRVPFKDYYTNALGQRRKLGVSMKAEARFLRAYFYFQLLKRYGGIPLMGDKVYNINDDLQLPRSTFEECVNYIVSELDTIQDSLRAIPMENTSAYAHVATKQACMALKTKVLLYAASPLFNENPIEAGNELVGYASYDRSRWKTAADAAREFIETYGDRGDKTFGLNSSFRNVFLNFYSTNNPELIFFRQNGKGKGIENTNGPLGFSGNNLGQGRTNPTQDLVDAFLMKDGSLRGQSSKYSYDPQHPYDNRDPRLDYTVLHNGSSWLGTTLQTYQGGANNPTSSNLTSYYMSKFMGDYTNSTEYSDQLHLWVIFRYAEILLDFAEAENEYLDAPSQDVYDAIIALRKRAGIEAGDDNLYGLKADMTQDEMRTIIHNERRIEMAFEEQRYYDIRRWREAETIFQSPLHGMRIVHSSASTSYNVSEVLNINFETKRYLYPIPYDEVNKNDNMVQNPNW